MNEKEVEKKLRAVIRDVPDFPKPGIRFKDITPILEDPVLCREIILVPMFLVHWQDRII